MNYQYLDSPLGRLRLVSDGENLRSIEFPGRYGSTQQDCEQTDEVLAACAAQLTENFAGDRDRFDLPLDGGGTDFQCEVWRALVEIPYGEVCSYRDIADRIGRPQAVRAVGAANGRNPLPIVVPSHRVIGSVGSLTGFAGALEAKTRQLELEGALPAE